jgi:hypothetical protein
VATGTREFVESILADADLAADLADALDDETFDAQIQHETDEALALTGKDVGTPIIQFGPPDGMAFFGPVISRLPSPADAVRLWDHVAGLAAFPGFAELKRSLREIPQLRAFGAEPAASRSSRPGRRPHHRRRLRAASRADGGPRQAWRRRTRKAVTMTLSLTRIRA